MNNQPMLFTIAPGVRLCAVHADRFKTGCMTFSMALPLEESTASANAIVPYILHRSCRRYPDFSSLNKRLAELYGASLSAGVSKNGETQVLSLSLTAIDDRFALAPESVAALGAELLLDLIFDPNLTSDGLFGEDAVRREKRLLIERMESEINDKRVFALRRCEQLMCAEEPYGIDKYGCIDHVEALTAEDITAAWRRMLNTAVIQVNMTGSADPAPIEAALKARFGTIPRTPARAETRFVVSAKASRRHEESLPVKQGKLVLGFRAGMAHAEDDTPAVKVMADVFGGGTYSKLFVHVRERLSLCYYCSARLNTQKGLIFVQSGIEFDKEQPATEEILRQLELLKAGDLPPEDFQASVLALCDRRQGLADSPDELNAWYAAQILRERLKTPEEDIEELRGVTPEQVIAAANRVTLDTVFMLTGSGEVHTDES